ncbi:MAG TPA: TlpA disulfide reductase family protein [Stellaceae bacterium]|nr:TlpA disulfide reductase family protein [Stellaceae bacterium]
MAIIASTAFPAALRADEPAINPGEFIAAATPQPAPEIAFADADGKPVALADFRGKFLILNLWATWCQPCLKEMPSLVALQARLAPALAVLAVAEDRGGEAVVAPFVAAHGLDKLRICLDPKSLAGKAFGVRGLPTSLMIDGDGRILGKVEGAADWDSDKMRDVLAKLMPAPGAATPR